MPGKRASQGAQLRRVFGQGSVGRRKIPFRAGLYARVPTHDQQILHQNATNSDPASGITEIAADGIRFMQRKSSGDSAVGITGIGAALLLRNYSVANELGRVGYSANLKIT